MESNLVSVLALVRNPLEVNLLALCHFYPKHTTGGTKTTKGYARRVQA